MKAPRAAALAFIAALAVLAPVGLAGCPPSLEDPERFQTGCPAGFSVDALFLATCTASACHAGGPAAAGGLDLASADAFDRMYGTTAAACGGLLISPNGPDESLLFAKLAGTATCGARMPLGGTPLSASDMACVQAWITANIAKAGPPQVGDAGGDAGSDAGSDAPAEGGDDGGDAGSDAPADGDTGEGGILDAGDAG